MVPEARKSLIAQISVLIVFILCCVAPSHSAGVADKTYDQAIEEWKQCSFPNSKFYVKEDGNENPELDICKELMNGDPTPYRMMCQDFVKASAYICKEDNSRLGVDEIRTTEKDFTSEKLCDVIQTLPDDVKKLAPTLTTSLPTDACNLACAETSAFSNFCKFQVAVLCQLSPIGCNSKPKEEIAGGADETPSPQSVDPNAVAGSRVVKTDDTLSKAATGDGSATVNAPSSDSKATTTSGGGPGEPSVDKITPAEPAKPSAESDGKDNPNVKGPPENEVMVEEPKTDESGDDKKDKSMSPPEPVVTEGSLQGETKDNLKPSDKLDDSPGASPGDNKDNINSPETNAGGDEEKNKTAAGDEKKTLQPDLPGTSSPVLSSSNMNPTTETNGSSTTSTQGGSVSKPEPTPIQTQSTGQTSTLLKTLAPLSTSPSEEKPKDTGEVKDDVKTGGESEQNQPSDDDGQGTGISYDSEDDVKAPTSKLGQAGEDLDGKTLEKEGTNPGEAQPKQGEKEETQGEQDENSRESGLGEKEETQPTQDEFENNKEETKLNQVENNRKFGETKPNEDEKGNEFEFESNGLGEEQRPKETSGQRWGGDSKPTGTKVLTMPSQSESPGSGHFFAYFLTAIVICISGYVIFHNKQKIIAFVVEGRNGKNGSRRRSGGGVKYSQLTSNVEEVMPSLDSAASSKNFAY